MPSRLDSFLVACLLFLLGDLVFGALAVARIALARVGTLVAGFEQAVPEGEEGLRKVGLDAPALMVDIVVGRIVRRDELQRVKRQLVAAVIVNSLEGRAGKEADGLAVRQPGDEVC